MSKPCMCETERNGEAKLLESYVFIIIFPDIFEFLLVGPQLNYVIAWTCYYCVLWNGDIFRMPAA